ncbi:MAG TPA: exosortase/archaeosortase family protein, partial [Cellvibrionaceae bacterium]|nr:exosortase/archaeosortase family protein [Cellvibrionaceae bacterium]
LAPQQLFVLALVPAIIGLYWPTISVLAGRWLQWDKGLSHGLLVAAVFIWLLWRRPSVTPPGGCWGLRLSLLGLASLLWFLMQSVQISLLAEGALLLVIIAAYSAWLGFAQSWRYKAILLLPLFATSLWGEFNSAALSLSSVVVGQLVELAGITAHLDGNTISLPYGQIIIADGCSGLRYMVIALALGHMLACLNHYPARGYWLTMAVALLLGLATNWLRIFVLVLVGYYTQMKSSLVADHETFGWLLFAGVVLPPLYFAPLRKAPSQAGSHFAPPLGRLLAVAAVLALGPVLLALSQRPPSPAPWLAALPLKALPPPSWAIQTPMPQAGLAEQGWQESVWLQRWQYQRVSSQDKLVPFIEANWHPDSQCKAVRTEALGAWFECSRFEQKVLVLRRFDVGRFASADFRRAKLWQLPAQWLGDNRFSLSQWQQRCEASSCEQAAAQISALAAQP